MSVYSDFVAFVDSGSVVPYFCDNCKYYYKPNIFSVKFEYQFKIYYRSYNDFYVGVHFSNFVRKILPSDFNFIKDLYELEINKKKKIGTQLLFDF